MFKLFPCCMRTNEEKEKLKNEKITVDDLVELFKIMDKDGNGLLERKEMKRVLKKQGIFEKHEIKMIFDILDADKDNEITCEEFVKGCKKLLNL